MIRRNNLTRDQWAALYKARRAGASIADLQDWFGVSSGVAREVARGYDGRPPREAAKVIYPRIAAWMVANRITWKVFTIETGLRYNTLRDILYGRTIQLSGTNINLREGGYYSVDVGATVSASAAGNVTLSLYQDGALVAQGSEAIAAANDPASVSFPAGVKVNCSSVLTLVVTSTAGDPIVTNVYATIQKV